MATLGNEDFKKMRKRIFQKGSGKTEFKKLANWMKAAELKAVLQAFENTWETTCKSQMKSAADTAAGKTLTPACAKYLGRIWMEYKIRQLMGEE